MKTRKKKLPEKSAPAPSAEDAAAASRFEKDLLTRGEATELTPDGKLPLKATHALVKKADGTTQIKRARYKLF